MLQMLPNVEVFTIKREFRLKCIIVYILCIILNCIMYYIVYILCIILNYIMYYIVYIL